MATSEGLATFGTARRRSTPVTWVARILADLAAHGARVLVREGKPRFLKPTGVALPEALLAAVRDHKTGLVCAINEPAVDSAERDAIAIEMGGVPEAYARAFGDIRANRPADVPRKRWDQFINDAGLFLDSFGQEATQLGWTADELFGLHPTTPVARYGMMGLIWMLRGERVTELTAKLARISDGLAFYRRPGKPSRCPVSPGELEHPCGDTEFLNLLAKRT
jgi:hypothetical protein